MPKYRPFIVGLPALSGLASITNQQHLDAIEKTEPGIIFGMVIATEDGQPPDYINNPWFTRCLWLDKLNGALKEFIKNTNSWDPVSLGAVSATAQLSDNVVTLDKISPAGGSALQILRLNSGGDPEYASLATILAANSVPLAAIYKTGAAEGSVLQIVTGGTLQWTPQATLASTILATLTSYDIQKLSNKVNSSLLVIDGSGNASFVTFASFFSTILPDASITISKLKADTASDLQVIQRVSGVPAWATPVFSKEQVITDSVAPPATGSNAIKTFAHTLGVKPKLVRVVLVCTTGDAPYSVGDEISIDTFGDVNNWGSVIIQEATKTNTVMLSLLTSAANYYRHYNLTPALAAITIANWRLRLYLYA